MAKYRVNEPGGIFFGGKSYAEGIVYDLPDGVWHKVDIEAALLSRLLIPVDAPPEKTESKPVGKIPTVDDLKTKELNDA